MKRFLCILFLIASLFPGLDSKGNWEVGIHFSYWTLNAAGSYAENNFTADFKNHDPANGDLNFDSDGNNYGIEVRFFPGGAGSSFSIGISYERNNFDLSFTGEYNDLDQFGRQYDAYARGSMELEPHAFNIGVRWELWPKNVIHPYIGVGLGFGMLSGTVRYETLVITYTAGGAIVEKTEKEQSVQEFLDELREDCDRDPYPINFLPFLNIQLGLRGEIVENFFFLAEASFYNGIMFRGGIAYRF